MSEAIKAAVDELGILLVWLYTEEVKAPKEYGPKRKAIVAALEALRPVAEGNSVIVPVEPSHDAIQNGYFAMRTDNVKDSSEQGRVKRIYRAIINT